MKNEKMVAGYDPRDDWYISNVRYVGGYNDYEYTFLTYEVREGSRCSRSIFADTEDEAWEWMSYYGAPKW